MLPHEDNVLNEFRIWKERHVQMRKPFQSPGSDEKLILLYYPSRGSNSWPPAHSRALQTWSRCPKPLTTRPRRRISCSFRNNKLALHSVDCHLNWFINNPASQDYKYSQKLHNGLWWSDDLQKHWIKCLLNKTRSNCSSAVEFRILKRQRLGSNPLRCCMEAWTFSFSPQCPSSLSCINEYLAIDGGRDASKKSLHAVIAVWLNVSQRSRVVSEWTGLLGERSNGLDTRYIYKKLKASRENNRVENTGRL